MIDIYYIHLRVSTICLAEEAVLESEEKETQFEKCERKPQSQLVKVCFNQIRYNIYMYVNPKHLNFKNFYQKLPKNQTR